MPVQDSTTRFLVTTYELAESDETPAAERPACAGDLSAARRQIEFVRRMLAHGYLDFDALDEADEALGKALRELDAYERGRVDGN